MFWITKPIARRDSTRRPPKLLTALALAVTTLLLFSTAAFAEGNGHGDNHQSGDHSSSGNHAQAGGTQSQAPKQATVAQKSAPAPAAARALAATTTCSGDLTGRISGGSATVTNDTPSAHTIGLASYRMFDSGIDNQQLFDQKQLSVAACSSATLSVSLPSCAYQIDLFHDTATITSFSAGNRYGSSLLDSRQVFGDSREFCTTSGTSATGTTPTGTTASGTTASGTTASGTTASGTTATSGTTASGSATTTTPNQTGTVATATTTAPASSTPSGAVQSNSATASGAAGGAVSAAQGAALAMTGTPIGLLFAGLALLLLGGLFLVRRSRARDL